MTHKSFFQYRLLFAPLSAFERAPLLNPYEAHVALGKTIFQKIYPMDFYAKDSGPWTNYYLEEKKKEKKDDGVGKREGMGVGEGERVGVGGEEAKGMKN